MTTLAKYGRFAASVLDWSLTIAILPPRNMKLNPSAITNYPSLNASLMQPVKDSYRGNHVVHRRKLLWVEEGQGE